MTTTVLSGRAKLALELLSTRSEPLYWHPRWLGEVPGERTIPAGFGRSGLGITTKTELSSLKSAELITRVGSWDSDGKLDTYVITVAGREWLESAVQIDFYSKPSKQRWSSNHTPASKGGRAPAPAAPSLTARIAGKMVGEARTALDAAFGPGPTPVPDAPLKASAPEPEPVVVRPSSAPLTACEPACDCLRCRTATRASEPAPSSLLPSFDDWQSRFTF
jgi:hypothetical protein